MSNEKSVTGVKYLNEKLIRLRKAAQLSQYDVAARLGIVRTAVTNWERGRNGPNKRILPRVAELYNCSVEDLLDGGSARK